MLTMDPPGSSQWMDPVEPELEAAMLNRYAGRAGPGGGLTRAPAPCPLGPGADVASVAAGANASIRHAALPRAGRAPDGSGIGSRHEVYLATSAKTAERPTTEPPTRRMVSNKARV